MKAWINTLRVGEDSGALDIKGHGETVYAMTVGDYGRGQSVQVRKRVLNETVIVGLFVSRYSDMGLHESYLPDEWVDSEVIYEHWFPTPGYQREVE